MRNNNSISGQSQVPQDPIQRAYTDLVLAIVANAIAVEGEGYLDSEDGRNWLEQINVEPDSIKRTLKANGGIDDLAFALN